MIVLLSREYYFDYPLLIRELFGGGCGIKKCEVVDGDMSRCTYVNTYILYVIHPHPLTVASSPSYP